MKYVVFLTLLFPLLKADNNYCTLPVIPDNHTLFSSREYYNIGDAISEDDQAFPHSVCHSDGYYDTGSTFRLSDYSGNIILISMNATW